MLRSRAAPLPMLAARYKVNFAVLCWPTDVLITGAMVIAGSTQLLQMVIYVVSERYHILTLQSVVASSVPNLPRGISGRQAWRLH